MLSKFVGFFKQGWLASLLGLIVVALIIWFLGGSIGWQTTYPLAEDLHRYIVIAALFVIWGVWRLWKVIRARRKNQKMVNLMAAREPELSPDDVAKEEEVGELRERLQDALQGLEKARKKSGKSNDSYLYQLPWYIIIGPPGAGKTTLLINSNLNFPLSDTYGRDAMRGIGGTRNCDWWFTDDAILLDTAGRFVIHGSQQAVNEGAWLGFLALLKEYRAHQPINGVLVAVSLADLLQQDDNLRASNAKAIRQRIQELHEQLGIRFPVYMMFTKADLVAGFSEFFDDLNRDSREQVWGMTFPYVDEPTQSGVELFESEFGLLEEQLNRQLVEKLENESSVERRRSLYLFPQQFSALKSNLQSFLNQVYQPTRFDKTAMLRGVYFTSATQEGNPIDRIMSSLASNFGVAPGSVRRSTSQGKSYFIDRLMSKVIFSESGLAGTNQHLRQKLLWLQSAVIVGAVVLALIGSMVWVTSYFQNRKLMTAYQQQVAQVENKMANLPPAADVETYFDVLDNVRDLTWSYNNNDIEIPWLSRFGLSQVRSLREVMDEKYVDLLKSRMTPYAKQLLEQKIREGINNSSQVESLFNALKAYLFWGGQADQGVSISGVSAIDWNSNGTIGEKNDLDIASHIEVLLEKGSANILDETLIDSARNALRGAELDKLAYYQFKAEGIEKAKSHQFFVRQKNNLSNINGTFQRKSQKAWTDNVEGFFTKAGYENIFLPNYEKEAKLLANESWVLGTNTGRLQDPTEIAKTFKAEYQRDYINAWTTFLVDLSPLSVNSVGDARAVLSGLTSTGGNMLLHLFKEVSHETDFIVEEEGDSILGFSINKLTETPHLTEVDRAFQDVHKWADEAQFQAIGSLIDEVFDNLNQEDVFGQLEKNSLTNALGKLQGEAQKLPPSVRGILQEVVLAIKAEVVGVIRNKLFAQFKGTLEEVLGESCQNGLQGKYPMAEKTKQGMTIGNFASFFQSNGKVDLFSQQHLNSKKVEKSVLENIEKQLAPAKVIRAAFLADGFPNFNYNVKLTGLDTTLWESVNLSIGTQSKDFKNGDSKVFKWPDGENLLVTAKRIPVLPAVTSPSENIFSMNSDKWVLFRSVNNNKLMTSIGVFNIQATSAPDPFKVVNNELRRFKCPTL